MKNTKAPSKEDLKKKPSAYNNIKKPELFSTEQQSRTIRDQKNQLSQRCAPSIPVNVYVESILKQWPPDKIVDHF